MNRIINWIFDTFGERQLERKYLGYNNFKEKRIWVLKIFKKYYYRDYDKDFN